ncbi:MAG: hypothetical protein ACFFCZ_07080 [Promethearchaeota archaeon]
MEFTKHLEKKLFGSSLEELFEKSIGHSIDIFQDDLEKEVFFFLLNLALSNQVGATSVLIADHTKKTKNTVNVRLERLYYKHLVQKQQIGNALLYFVPVHRILLEQTLKDYSEQTNLDLKDLLRKYLRDTETFFAPTLGYYREKDEKEPKKVLKDIIGI